MRLFFFFFFFFFFNGSRKALVNMGMDAIFMFMRVGGWVTHLFVCAFLMKAALTWMNGSVVALITQRRNQSASREAEKCEWLFFFFFSLFFSLLLMRKYAMLCKGRSI